MLVGVILFVYDFTADSLTIKVYLSWPRLGIDGFGCAGVLLPLHGGSGGSCGHGGQDVYPEAEGDHHDGCEKPRGVSDSVLFRMWPLRGRCLVESAGPG